jgi:hypothetical protein
MKIATYNVNGVNGRLPVLLRWLKEAQPDIVCLQELKAPQENFPISAIRKAGYGAVWHGQKAWNGVAILALGTDPVELRRGLPGDPEDIHSRYIEAAARRTHDRRRTRSTRRPFERRRSAYAKDQKQREGNVAGKRLPWSRSASGVNWRPRGLMPRWTRPYKPTTSRPRRSPPPAPHSINSWKPNRYAGTSRERNWKRRRGAPGNRESGLGKVP